MIRIKDLSVKNFMSVGNQTQAVDFCKEQLTLVLGENLDQGGDDSGSRNGTGKTTIINALSYAIYGQALTNIKKDNLINKVNGKNMLVTVNFEKDGTDYRIERGRKSNVLKFYINGEALDAEDEDESQGDSRETQKEIEKLFGISHDMFKHIVALNTYTEPFLSMRANDQRMIIEQLLGITLLSEKADSLKEVIKSTKEKIQEEKVRIDAIKHSNDKIQETINSLKLKQTAWNGNKVIEIEKIVNAINELQSINIEKELEQHAKLKVYDDQSKKITSLNKERATLETALMQAEKNWKKFVKEVEDLANHNCPKCDQPVHDAKYREMKQSAEKSLSESALYMESVGGKLELVLNELKEIGDINGRPKTSYDTVEEALKHQNNLQNLENALVNKVDEVDPYTEQIDELQNTAIQEIIWDTVNDLSKLLEHQEFLLKLLTNKDSFVRKKIIDQNLAYLNNRLTFYLDRLGLPHQVLFQNDLTVEITQLGQDLDFDNLSRGERNRLILGLSFAFRDVWESLYQNINLMFIDEMIDSGMDASGVENSLGVLKKMARERKKNIYLISHRDELIGRVNNVLKVIKENGYTSYSNDLEITD
jgi:DNA repair exonuclease SbcCD ATPase subunit